MNLFSYFTLVCQNNRVLKTQHAIQTCHRKRTWRWQDKEGKTFGPSSPVKTKFLVFSERAMLPRNILSATVENLSSENNRKKKNYSASKLKTQKGLEICTKERQLILETCFSKRNVLFQDREKQITDRMKRWQMHLLNISCRTDPEKLCRCYKNGHSAEYLLLKITVSRCRIKVRPKKVDWTKPHAPWYTRQCSADAIKTAAARNASSLCKLDWGFSPVTSVLFLRRSGRPGWMDDASVWVHPV